MKLIDFKTNEEFTFSDLRCKLRISKKILSDSGRIQLTGNNEYKLLMGDAVYDFTLLDEIDSRILADKLKQYTYNLAYVSANNNDRDEFSLHVAFFYTANREPKLNIVLSGKVKETLEKKHLVSRGQDIEVAVRDNFLLSDGNNVCYAYTRGKYRFVNDDVNEENTSDVKVSSDNSSEVKTSDEDEYVETNKTSERSAEEVSSIRLYGKDYSVLVRLQGEEDDLYLYAESVDTRNRHTPPMALRIGDLSFKDGEKFVSEKIKKELAITSGYLDIWDKYTNIEGDFLLQKAKQIGEIYINRNKINEGEGGLIVYPEGLNDEQKALISTGDFLMFSESIPVYMVGDGMTWIEYKQVLDTLKELNMDGQLVKTVIRKIIKVDRSGYWVIDSGDDRKLPEGIITYSLFGDMQQIIRRETARQLIANGESAFPSLGLVIEGKKPETSINSTNIKDIEPVTAFVKEKIFSHEPRPRQIDAIKMALNTPDICIIQGPPGTGKTTVITAIIERLNEIADKRKDNRGQVLITSFQHDAVRNVIGRLSINSLPTIKFGKQCDDDVSQERAIEDWCHEYAEALKKKNPSIQQTLEQMEFSRRHNAYLASPNDSNAELFLNYVKSINVDNDISDEIDEILADIRASEITVDNKLLNKIRRIRTTMEGFNDDGAFTADDVLAELEVQMNPSVGDNRKILEVLEEAADCLDGNCSEELLEELKIVKKELLRKCSPRPVYRIEEPRQEVLDIYTRVQASLRKPQNEMDEILFNLLNELENNVVEVENTVASYNFVYAATAQQSEGRDIKRAKNVKQEEHPEYDTVIIDEAARVNPGDLMVPMAQARRRIILVGDHRQLPHIYNEEVFESMRDNGNDVGKDVVKISMFQYLKKKADELKAIDGIERTITLDAQYRMHPELGQFVNENFYEPYDEGFESPLAAENFAQQLCNTPYRWVNVQNEKMREHEKKDGTSRIRKKEAEYIVNTLREYILSEEGKNLSYGVITFYSAQASLIKKMLKDKDISERVRVGTVDAFQGMEFDVIFLSVVRTHSQLPDINFELLGINEIEMDEESSEYREWLEYKETVGMNNYGFLTSENRLCVALSRQKKLLIVVGDSNIFYGDGWKMIASKCVPAMKNFYEKCIEKGAVIEYGQT